MKPIKITLFISLAMAACLAYSQDSKDVQGAAAVLKQFSSAQSASVGSNFDAELKAYRHGYLSASAADAANWWLKLLDLQFASVPAIGGGDFGQLDTVVQLMPGPDSWAAIKAGLTTRAATDKSDYYLCYAAIFDGLTGDTASEWQKLDAMFDKMVAAQAKAMAAAKASEDDSGMDMTTRMAMSGYQYSNLVSAYLHLAERTNDKPRFLKAIKAALSMDTMGIAQVHLVKFLGKEEAARVLREAIPTMTGILYSGDTDDRALLRQVVTENIDQLKKPLWSLATDLDSADLFKAMWKKFPPKASDANNPETAMNGAEYGSAEADFLMGLAKHGKMDEALAFAKQNPNFEFGNLSYEVEREKDVTQIDELLYQLASQDIGSKSWTILGDLETRTGHEERFITLAKEAGLSSQAAGLAVMKAYLAEDEVDKAVSYAKVAMDKQEGVPSNVHGTNQLAEELCNLGVALNEPSWVRYAVHKAQPGLDDWAVDGLRRAGLYAEAEQQAVAEANQGDSSLQGLARLYDQAGRYADVLTLLDKANGWGVKDVSDLRTEDFLGLKPESPDMSLITARALVETGQKQRAIPILENYLSVVTNDDAAYQELYKALGDGFIPEVEKIATWNQFEERPVLWKAKALFDKKQYDEAEKVCRAAIAIDPSDGDQPKGRRMLAYSVLADILEAKGDKAGAETNRNVVKAIRMSEDGDVLLQLGLMKRAVGLYADSLKIFDDAYCIQSRLAINLAAEGKYDEAAAHYEKAFELMPVSFGYVETHCFGCERTFDTDEAVKIAERVFNKELADKPNQPQVHYLLGYLHDEEGRYHDALLDFEKAVELAPDYANAWGKIVELGQLTEVPYEVTDKAQVALARFGKLRSYGMLDQHDQASLYKAGLELFARRPAALSSVYPLKAVVVKPDDMSMMHRRFNGFRSGYLMNLEDPGAMIGYQPGVEHLARYAQIKWMFKASVGMSSGF